MYEYLWLKINELKIIPNNTKFINIVNKRIVDRNSFNNDGWRYVDRSIRNKKCGCNLRFPIDFFL